MTRFPLAQRFIHRKLERFDYEYELRRELAEMYPDFDDLRRLTLADIWQLARDLTCAVERIARKHQETAELSGEEKMELAYSVIWSFIEVRGGIEAIREIVAGRSSGRFARFRRWVTRQFLNDQMVQDGLKAVLELAVAELKAAARRKS